MFNCRLDDYTLLKTSFESISKIVSEVQIQTDSDGIRLDALDKSHITFIHLEFCKDYFSEYVCTEPEKINVDTEQVLKVLKRGKHDDALYLSVDENNLIFDFNGDVNKHFKIRLIDMDYTAPSPPELVLSGKSVIPFKVLKDSMSDMGLFSEKVLISIKSDKTVFIGKGDMGDSQVEYNGLYGSDEDNIGESTYSLEKINELLRADKFSAEAILELGVNTPLTLTLQNEDETGTLSFLLAPRIESDDL